MGGGTEEGSQSCLQTEKQDRGAEAAGERTRALRGCAAGPAAEAAPERTRERTGQPSAQAGPRPERAEGRAEGRRRVQSQTPPREGTTGCLWRETEEVSGTAAAEKPRPGPAAGSRAPVPETGNGARAEIGLGLSSEKDGARTSREDRVLSGARAEVDTTEDPQHRQT